MTMTHDDMTTMTTTIVNLYTSIMQAVHLFLKTATAQCLKALPSSL